MCHNGAFAVWFLHSKKGGKIQTGLNCEVDSLSKACLWLAYSSRKKTRPALEVNLEFLICFFDQNNREFGAHKNSWFSPDTFRIKNQSKWYKI